MIGDVEGFTECSHGWHSPHCIRDNEGSCPVPNKDWLTAECRCNESEWLKLRYDTDLNAYAMVEGER